MSSLPAQYHEVDAVYRATIGNDLRAIGVTAPREGHGVSTLAMALAERSALADRSTLLVELTTRASALTERHGVSRQDWTDAPGSAAQAWHTLRPGLTGLPSPSLSRPTPLLRERAVLARLRDEWLERFDLIIYDLPPVLATSQRQIDPLVAAANCNGVIISVTTRLTTEADLIACVDQLRRADAELLGIVVNDRENPALADEVARELGRLKRLHPGLIGRLQRWVRKRAFLHKRP
ncbi:MAG: hypothetical protein ACFB3T_15380 [Geminicoccaceae bacterium]